MLLIGILALPFAAAHPSARSALSLDGAWRYAVGEVWTPSGVMNVPSNWYTEGQDVHGVVWFGREVDVPDDGRWTVRFAGVDYAADVYWDGAPIAHHTGYFGPFEVEVPAGGGRHELRVRVDSPDEASEDFSLRKQLIKGVLGHHDTRPGGAWSSSGQDANTGGIWGDVQLEPVRRGRVAIPRVWLANVGTAGDLQRVDGAWEASVHVSVAVRNLRGAARVRYSLRDPDGVVIDTGSLGRVMPSAGGGAAVTATLHVHDARLWLLAGSPGFDARKGAALYTLEVTLDGDDAVSTRFGIRTVAQDSQGRMLLNGQPVFVRGTNVIGSMYLASYGRAEVIRDLDLIQAANINAIRVHAHITSPALYDAADERGLMVFQDFPLQWGYNDSPTFQAEAVRQLDEMLDLLHHHPSIVFWTAHNEAPWSADWMRWKYPDWDPDQNRALDRALGDELAKQEPSRPFEENAHPAEHAWQGWYFGSVTDFAKPLEHAVFTEFGAQALSNLETMLKILPENRRWPLDPPTLAFWEYHDFQLDTLTNIAKIPLASSLAEEVRVTQENQADAIQRAAEEMRRQAWQPITAIFQFMFNEHWASMSWGVVDHLRHPKPGYASLQRAYQPILPIATARPKQTGLALYIINDGTLPFPANLTVRYKAASASTTTQTRVRVGANGVTALSSWLRRPSADEALTLSLAEEAGRVLSTNAYHPGWFQKVAE